VERSPEVARYLPLIHEAMPFVAHAAVRNRGTFGGSIALADPAAELPACCLALDASLILRSRSGERRVAAREFFKDLYETDMRPGEVLAGGEFAVPGEGYRCSFQEFARRHGDYAIVGVAAGARFKGGALSDVRLAFCGMGPTPMLATTSASALEGRDCSPDDVARAQALLSQDLTPFDDLYQTAATRCTSRACCLVVPRADGDGQWRLNRSIPWKSRSRSMASGCGSGWRCASILSIFSGTNWA
jgi:carbon-monoxide dehydrogenase medium subunit